MIPHILVLLRERFAENIKPQLLESLARGRLTMNYCIHTHIVRQVDVRVNKRIIPDADPRHDTDLDTGAAIITDKGTSLSRPVSTSESPI